MTIIADNENKGMSSLVIAILVALVIMFGSAQAIIFLMGAP